MVDDVYYSDATMRVRLSRDPSAAACNCDAGDSNGVALPHREGFHSLWGEHIIGRCC